MPQVEVKAAGLDGRLAVVLGDVDLDLERDVGGVAGEVAEVEAQLVDALAAVDQLRVDDLVALDVEGDAGAGRGEAADPIQLAQDRVRVEALRRREVDVVGEAGAWEVGLPQSAAALQGDDVSERRDLEQAADQPAEDVVALDVAPVQPELVGLRLDLIALNHLALIAGPLRPAVRSMSCAS